MPDATSLTSCCSAARPTAPSTAWSSSRPRAKASLQSSPTGSDLCRRSSLGKTTRSLATAASTSSILRTRSPQNNGGRRHCKRSTISLTTQQANNYGCQIYPLFPQYPRGSGTARQLCTHQACASLPRQRPRRGKYPARHALLRGGARRRGGRQSSTQYGAARRVPLGLRLSQGQGHQGGPRIYSGTKSAISTGCTRTSWLSSPS